MLLLAMLEQTGQVIRDILTLLDCLSIAARLHAEEVEPRLQRRLTRRCGKAVGQESEVTQAKVGEYRAHIAQCLSEIREIEAFQRFLVTSNCIRCRTNRLCTGDRDRTFLRNRTIDHIERSRNRLAVLCIFGPLHGIDRAIYRLAFFSCLLIGKGHHDIIHVLADTHRNLVSY